VSQPFGHVMKSRSLRIGAMLLFVGGLGAGVHAQEKLFKTLRMHAEQGDADAQYRLGSMYDYGQGFLQDLQDDVEAVKWYRLAAKQHHVEAQLVLGYRYQRGEGVPRDHVLSYMWFDLAVSRASDAIRVRAIRARTEVAELLTFDERQEAKERAQQWDRAHPLH